MATENTFTQLPNDFMEVLMSSAPNHSEVRVLVYLARKTYGFHKKSDGISLTQFENKLSMARETVSKSLSTLQLVGLVRLVKKGNSKKAPNIYLIDLTDYPKKLVRLAGLVRFDRKKLVQLVRHTKESITKEREKFFPQSSVPNQIREGILWSALDYANKNIGQLKSVEEQRKGNK